MPYQIGPYLLDELREVIFLDGAVVSTSRTVASLLRGLAEARLAGETVVSHERLLEFEWMSERVSRSAIYKRVDELRTALCAMPGAVQTMRGRGIALTLDVARSAPAQDSASAALPCIQMLPLAAAPGSRADPESGEVSRRVAAWMGTRWPVRAVECGAEAPRADYTIAGVLQRTACAVEVTVRICDTRGGEAVVTTRPVRADAEEVALHLASALDAQLTRLVRDSAQEWRPVRELFQAQERVLRLQADELRSARARQAALAALPQLAAEAQFLRALCCFYDYWAPPDAVRAEGIDAARQCLQADHGPPSDRAIALYAALCSWRAEHDAALAAAELIDTRSCEAPLLYWLRAFVLAGTGRARDAVQLLERSVALAPEHPMRFHMCQTQALACLALGDVEAAVVHARASARLQPRFPDAYVTLAAAHALTGNTAAARRALRSLPTDVSLAAARAMRPDVSQAWGESLLQGLEAIDDAG